jgi:hypothetical protein
MRVSLCVLSLLLIIPLSAHFSKVIIRPVRFENENSSFKKAYQEVLDIARNKDYKKIQRYVSKNHTSQFEAMKADFNLYWELTPSANKKSALWQVLQISLDKGCAKNGEIVICPFYFNTFPEGCDSHECGLIVGTNVNIRKNHHSMPKLSQTEVMSM